MAQTPHDALFKSTFDKALGSEVADYVPRFRFLIDDLSRATDEDLRSRAAMTALGKLVLGCFRHAHDPRALLGDLGAWAGVLRALRRSRHGMEALAVVLRYLFAVAEKLSVDEVRGLVEGTVEPDVQEEIVTLAEQLREEGRKDGIVKGEAEMLLKLLRLKFRKVPTATAARVRAASQADLDRWAERVLTASTVADVLDR